MGYFSDLDIDMQEGRHDNDVSPSQDDIEQHAQKPMPSEEAILRFLSWLELKKEK